MTKIVDFIKDELAFSKDTGLKTPHIQVRGAAQAKRVFARELRTKKNDYQAVSWDELGNVTILDKRGNVRLLHPSEYEGA